VASSDAVWERRGAAVTNTAKYLPGCFDKPPGNPAEKQMNSGYKAREHMTFLYVLCPALLRDILPENILDTFLQGSSGRVVHLAAQNFVSTAPQIVFQWTIT
jgi:hypothetical protein